MTYVYTTTLATIGCCNSMNYSILANGGGYNYVVYSQLHNTSSYFSHIWDHSWVWFFMYLSPPLFAMVSS